MSAKVSLKTIANRAGVTPATVSLALRGHLRISEAKRLEIARIAKELGYRPHPEIRRLMSMLREGSIQTEHPVMGLVSDRELPLRQSPASRVWPGFRDRANALGYIPQEFHLNAGMTPARLAKILDTRNVRGLVFAPLQHMAIIEKLDLSRLATAAIGNSISEPVLQRASSDKYYNTLLACKALWERGCRRLALVVPKSQEARVEHTFLSGYLVFHHNQRHPDWPEPLVDEEPWDPDRIVDWVRRWRPDGIIAAYHGLRQHLKEGSPPITPMPFVAQVNTLQNEATGIDQQHGLIAATAVDLVDAQLRRGEFGLSSSPKSILIRGSWVECYSPAELLKTAAPA